MTKQNVFADFVTRYHQDPVLFVQEVLGIDPQPWQGEFLKAVARGERRISVKSAHGVGKSSACSWAMLWVILTHYPSKQVCTAPTSSQLFDALWAELRANITKLPDALQTLLDVTADRVALRSAPDECFISARTARAEKPEALQGVHSTGRVVLYADEASGVDEQVFEAAIGSMSGHSATTVLTSNPTRTSGFFFETHNRAKDEWWRMTIAAPDCPFVSPDYVRQVAIQYGEHSNVYRVRVLGEFPLADDDTLIPLELAQMAVNRDVIQNPDAPILWGVDVARFGTDSSALCKRQSNVVLEPIRLWKNLDLMSLTGAILHEYESADFKQRPAEILVDSIGLGAGVVDRLRELKLPVRGINVGESPAIKGQYMNLRAELWGKAKTWLEARDCKLPRDERLVNELSSPRYSFMSNGKLKLESKDDMKRRGLASPDAADAFVLTFASEAATVGGSYTQTWNKTVKRQIRGVV